MTDTVPAPDQHRAAAVLAGGTLVSRLLGCLRDILVAHLLGPGADAFLVAFRLPNVFRRLLAEGSLGMAHAAAFARLAAEEGPAAALAFARSVWAAVFLASLPLTLALAAAAHPLVLLLAPGFLDRPESAAHAAFLLRCCLPYLPFCCLCAVGAATQACRGKLFPQAFSTALLNAAMLCAGLAALLSGNSSGLPAWGAGRHATGAAELALCLGLLLGGCIQLAALGDFGRASGGAWSALLPHPSLRFRPPQVSWFPVRAWKDARVRALLARMPLLAVGAAPHQMLVLAGTVLASFLAPGGISALYFAERLLELPLGCIGAAAGLAALPRLAVLAAGRDSAEFSRTLAASLRLCAFFSLPAAVGLAVLAPGLTRLLFTHGAFGEMETARTALALQAFSLGLPAMCASRPLLAALSALNLPRAPLAAACKSLLPSLAVGAACLPFADAAGIGLGVAAGSWANAALLLRALPLSGILRRDAALYLRYFTAALLMGLCLIALPAPSPHRLALAAQLGGAVFACAAAWVLLFHRLRSPEAAALLRLFRRKERKRL